VADFGLVKDLEGMAASVTGGVTPVYAAPETFDGWVSRFSDQYSLAIVYQELLTGLRPFSGNNVRQLVLQHLQGTPNLTPLPADDQPIIARALSKGPAERHPTCLDMVRGLARPAAPTVPETIADCGLPIADSSGQIGNRQSAIRNPPMTPSRTLNVPRTPPPANSAPVTPITNGQNSQRPTRWVGGPRAAPPTPASRPPSSHTTGEGTLLPALVVGVGGAGLAVLRRLRSSLQALAPRPGAFDHLRFLYLDTDPQQTREATRGRPDTCFGGGEVLLARINRPSHYLKPRDGRPPLDAWFDPQMLYRIPRTQTTAGCRASAGSPSATTTASSPRASAPSWKRAPTPRRSRRRRSERAWVCAPPGRGFMSSPRWRGAAAAACSSTWPTLPAPPCATWATQTPTWWACSCCRPPTAPRPTRCRSAIPAPP